jgi:hypothetical protein
MCVTMLSVQQLAEMARHHRPAADTWRLGDAPELPIQPDGPVLVSPLPPEQAAALEEAALAHERIERKIAAMKTHPAPRAADCTRTFLRLRRHLEGGGVEEGLFRPACNRSSCPWCLRHRIIRTLMRASETLLDAHASRLGGVGRIPRTLPVHVAWVDWSAWESTDRAIRRQYPDFVDPKGRCNVGRLRVRQKGGRTLIVCEFPFAGSRPVKPPEALDMVSAAVDRLDLDRRECGEHGEHHTTGMHSYRQMGRWYTEPVKRWELLKKSIEPFDFDRIQRELSALEVRAKYFQRSTMAGLLWRVDSDEAADQLWAACPSLSNPGDKEGEKTDSDEGGTDIPEEWETPYDPEANRWT